jgi:hypothetical protein
MYYESCVGIWSDFNNNNNILCTAQDSGGYVVRNCSFYFNFSGSFQQFFDFHGNQGTPSSATAMRGTYALGIYNNTFTCSGTSSSIQFALIRAGSGLIFSNSVTGSGAGGAGIDLFEEEASGVWGYTGPPYYDQITNVWIWNNGIVGVGYTDTATANIAGNGLYWHNSAPSPVVTLAFPHPLIAAQDGGGQTNPVINITPPSLDFGSPAVGSSNTLTLTVQNIGGGTLAGNASIPTSTFGMIGTRAYSLTAGQRQTITVSFTPTQSGITNQTVTFTGGATATVTGNGQVLRTAIPGQAFPSTQGNLSPPFATNADNTISQAVETTDPTQGGEAVYLVNIASAGNYVVSANVWAPGDAANSVLINFDSEPTSPDMIWDMQVSNSLTNQFATRRSKAGVTQVWTLSAGTHQLILRGREAAVELGAITVLPAALPPRNLHIAASGS